jgi:hypothetical protein
MTDDSEVEHAEGLGELLPRTIEPDELAGYLVQRFSLIERPLGRSPIDRGLY